VPQALSRLSCADQVRAGFLDQPRVCFSAQLDPLWSGRGVLCESRSGDGDPQWRCANKVRNHLAGSHHADWESSGACGSMPPRGV